MLTRLRFQNFKSWRKAEVPLAPLTALFGANSSGKSSLLQFLLLLKQTKDSPDRSLALDFGGEDSPADLGSFRDAVHAHQEEESISWHLQWRLPQELKIADPSGKRSEALFIDNKLQISSSVRLRNRNVVGDGLEYDFAGSQFVLRREKERPGFQLEAHPASNFRFIRTVGRKWDLPGPTKSYAFPDQARTYFQNSQFLSEFETAYVGQMDAILHLGPLRDYPRRQYIWAGSSPIDVGRRGERTVEAILAATARGEQRNLRAKARRRPFQEMVAWWLKELGLISSFKVTEVAPGAGLYRAMVRRDPESPETSITDVGFGVSQILPALVLLYYAPEHSTVILEQPEIHLHPAVQSALADVIITVVKSRNIQVILESHSEHLLQRLLRRIAEGKDSPYPIIAPSDVKLFFCQATQGVSRINELKVNLFGSIENWPDDFFGDQFGEIAAREEAAAVRRQRAAE
jgi:predicted ATPase